MMIYSAFFLPFIAKSDAVFVQTFNKGQHITHFCFFALVIPTTEVALEYTIFKLIPPNILTYPTLTYPIDMHMGQHMVNSYSIQWNQVPSAHPNL